MVPDPHPWLDLAAAFRELDQPANALYAVRNALGARPNSAEAHHSHGLTLLRLERDDEAADAFRRAVALDPLHTRARFNYATLVRRDAPREARLHLAVLYRHDPGLADLLAGQLKPREETA